MFNVKVKKFLNTEQIQIFFEPLLSSDSEREDRRRVIFNTGEIVPSNRTIIYNPFDDEDVIGYELSNDEQNIQRSIRRTKNKIYDIAKSNLWEWFFTLTFNPEKVDSYDYSATTEKLSKWLNNMRRTCPDMKYVVVPEQHESGRWHFHGLFANVEKLEFVNSGKRDKKGRVIYNVGKYRLGWSTATKIESIEKACNYIAKYVSEDLCAVTRGKKRYWYSRNVQLPIVSEYIIEGQKDFIKYMSKNAFYTKTIQGFNDVTYIELPLGDSDFILSTEEIL